MSAYNGQNDTRIKLYENPKEKGDYTRRLNIV